MSELEKIKEEITFLKFNLENELNDIRKQSESTLKFIKSQTEVTKAITQSIKDNVIIFNDIKEKFDIKNIEINGLDGGFYLHKSTENDKSQSIKLNENNLITSF